MSGPKHMFLYSNGGADKSPLYLIVKGQGVILFRTLEQNLSEISFTLSNDDKSDQLMVKITNDSIISTRTSTGENYIDEKNKSGLSSIPGAYYWVSLDSKNQQLILGVGEARMETKSYFYKFPNDNAEVYQKNKKFLESIDRFDFDTSMICPIRILRDPISRLGVPLLVKDKDNLTMNDIAGNVYLPVTNLPPVSQQMHGCVGGKMFMLDTPDFPYFSAAIEHSINTPGCWCYKKLHDKANEFNPDKPDINGTYLRITMGGNDGESPGIPYVMEIWPPKHYSPIHNHAGANAVIRVLHGSIQVSLYPFLSDNEETSIPFAVKNFGVNDVTWLSPYLNQVHKLTNINSYTACITIQCYLYSKPDDSHYDYFDYISTSGGIEHYEPDSDMSFLEFKEKMKEEWVAMQTSRTSIRNEPTTGLKNLLFI